jgi:hypothetical protein
VILDKSQGFRTNPQDLLAFILHPILSCGYLKRREIRSSPGAGSVFLLWGRPGRGRSQIIASPVMAPERSTRQLLIPTQVAKPFSGSGSADQVECNWAQTIPHGLMADRVRPIAAIKIAAILIA